MDPNETLDISDYPEAKYMEKLEKFWHDNHPKPGAVPSEVGVKAAECKQREWYYHDIEGWMQKLSAVLKPPMATLFLSTNGRTVIAPPEWTVYPIATEDELEEAPRLDDDGNEIPSWKKHMYDRLFEDDKMKKDILCPECSSSNVACFGGFSSPGFINDKALECKSCTHHWIVSQAELDKIKEESSQCTYPGCQGKGIISHPDDTQTCGVRYEICPKCNCTVGDLEVGEKCFIGRIEWHKFDKKYMENCNGTLEPFPLCTSCTRIPEEKK